MDYNMIIVNNIQKIMKEKNIKQVELAQKINVSKQIISKMLNGGRIINAYELSLISNALSVNIEKLVEIPDQVKEINTVTAFMGEIKSPEAKKGLEISDKIADMILFHKKTIQNWKSMMRKFED